MVPAGGWRVMKHWAVDGTIVGSLFGWAVGWMPAATIFLTFIIACLRVYQMVRDIRKGK